MTCQNCGQAEAEWKVRMYRGANREDVIRFWHLCDVCVVEVIGPWIKYRIPPLEEGQMWSSANGGKTYRKSAALASTASSTTT